MVFIIWQRPLFSGVPSDNLVASEGGCPEPRLLGVPLFPNMIADASLKASVSYFPDPRLPDLTITENFGLIPYARAVSYFPAPRLNCLGVSAPTVRPG